MSPSAPAATFALQPPPPHSLRSALRVALATLRGTARRPAAAPAAAAGTPPAPTRHVAVAPGGRAVSYLAAGTPGAPRLVLVHGTPGRAEGWMDYLRAPPGGFEVLAPDRPGFGASAPHDGALTSLAAQAEAMSALLPDERRATVLVGHSLGGAVAARLAAELPHRVDALVLLAAALDPALERVHLLQRLGAWPPLRACLPRALRHANDELIALARELETLRPLLARIRCPVFVVHGLADDLVPVTQVVYLQRELRGAAVHTELLPGQGHFLPWQAAAEVRRAIARAGQASC
ncbi:MAG: alpha/beta fold hydrolase [Rubrivivax sp.]|nr:alpha/beta fold hydrolase [Rubrivivax sp.]